MAIIDAHARSVLPDELVTLDTVDEIRVGLDQPRECVPKRLVTVRGSESASKTMRGLRNGITQAALFVLILISSVSVRSSAT